MVRSLPGESGIGVGEPCFRSEGCRASLSTRLKRASLDIEVAERRAKPVATERTRIMTALVRVDIGDHAKDLTGLPIVVNGVDLGRVTGRVTEVETSPGWSIIVLGHGLEQSAPARFYAYREDVVQVEARRTEESMVAVGGVLGGLYSLFVTHSRPVTGQAPT